MRRTRLASSTRLCIRPPHARYLACSSERRLISTLVSRARRTIEFTSAGAYLAPQLNGYWS